MSLNISEILNHLHINDNNEAFSTGSNWGSSADAQVKTIVSPVDGKKIASVKLATESDYNKVIEKAGEAFKKWRTIPAPKRGEIVRQIGDALRNKKTELGTL
ncbi:MAG: aldehyde dehydrogenase family protein, partial [Mucilaginibacter sp.]